MPPWAQFGYRAEDRDEIGAQEEIVKLKCNFTLLLFVLPILVALPTSAITINDVFINYTNNQITINGKNLTAPSTAPLVTLNGASIRVIEYGCAPQPTGCFQIVATLPTNNLP